MFITLKGGPGDGFHGYHAKPVFCVQTNVLNHYYEQTADMDGRGRRVFRWLCWGPIRSRQDCGAEK